MAGGRHQRTLAALGNPGTASGVGGVGRFASSPRGGVDALTATVAADRAPVTSEAALRVAEPAAGRRNWTIARRRAEIEAGEGVLLDGDESEALMHHSLAPAWAWTGVDRRVPAPGQAKTIAHREHLERLYGAQPGRPVKPG